MSVWPVQSKCEDYYGIPTYGVRKHLVMVKCPWALYFDSKPVTGIMVHQKCASSLERVLNRIWERVGKSQEEIDRIGMSKFSGSYNPRKIAGTNRWSMHAFGAAIDFDSANNWLGDTTPAMDRRVVEEFEREGWEWGGHWSRPDGMHFQAAWTRLSPPRLGPMTQVAKVTVKQLAPVSRKVSFLDRVRQIAAGVGAAAGSVFTVDNLGLFQGWMGLFKGLGAIALVVGVCALGYWLVSSYILKKTVEDFEEGRYTPSGAAPQPSENTDAVVEQPAV